MSTEQEDRIRSLEVAIAVLETTVRATEKALELQALEYERRLHALNGEYTRDRERQKDYITVDKYEDKIEAMDKARVAAVEAEKSAREAALLRVNENLNDYVKRWEQRQRETEMTISTLSAAAAEAKQIAENQGRQTREEADQEARRQKEAAEANMRRQNRNITIMGICLAAIVGLVNLLPGF